MSFKIKFAVVKVNFLLCKICLSMTYHSHPGCHGTTGDTGYYLTKVMLHKQPGPHTSMKQDTQTNYNRIHI